MAQNIDHLINDLLHRIMKEMQLLMGERYPLYINCHGIENLSYLFVLANSFGNALIKTSVTYLKIILQYKIMERRQEMSLTA